ncbi:NACHT, LRR and PYD domains-containing protein 3 [Alligator mississippiensis]|uniref:NACHT, LRR and PYD domains-containing protein 3 n=1 Tax=Alligator mississippiensis TaxID=8496 RepID=UPI002877DD4C|nr:NACHT, LRR and PYD domains-containing protein 3 [Alligator mississippiensis]
MPHPTPPRQAARGSVSTPASTAYEEAAAVGKGSGNDMQAVTTLLANYGKPMNHLMLTVRFLFGLLNEERMKDIEKKLSCKISLKIKPELLKWFEAKPQTPDLSLKSHWQKSSLGAQVKAFHQLEEFHCLYEIQEENFVQSALSHLRAVNLSSHEFTQMDQEVLAFCLKNCHKLDSLLLQFCDFRYEAPDEDVSRSPKQPPLEQETHSPIYLLCQALKDPHCKVKRLWLQWCVLTPTCCRDLVAVLSTCPSLTELDLSHNTRVGDGGVQLLCEGLRHPSCKLQTLRLWNCRLTPTCCGALTAVLSTSPSLMELDLSYNGDLGDGGVRLLCEGLRHPSCKLQTLRLQWCGLTDTCCEDLAAALSTSPSLTELDLTHNSGLGAGGVQLLCEGLRQPSCKLQTLGLTLPKLNAETKQELEAVKGMKPGLIIEQLEKDHFLKDKDW